MSPRLHPLALAALLLGFAFLYGPILLLIVYSFNDSRLVTVWGGFSTRWYANLAADGPLIEATLTTLKVAFASASLATMLGTLAALALDRRGGFPGRTLFSGLLVAPMVMPEVIIGLSLLLLFVALGIDRGLWTIVAAHTTFTLCFVTVVVQARLRGLDRSLIEAAADLGAPPATILRTVTLPLLLPAIVAGFLLAFTLSMDDLVIASFVSGPGATTLPMRLYSQVRLGVTPQINAISTLLIATVAVSVLIASLLTARRGA
ncbi:ABC transporter permease [Methylobacterium nodulans]|uniref:Binding-protein-dependent transport systems inner membrane component n=1 Tax=Methylobacterium nodulans (strain LMG 21967 / CNCM I-2342 / ORS 2060) TaxID=460265 RepID=B8IG56_METNO|nr:ABC transporter permease [Methylobacterium nodulans]ACL61533.1 binding-protein-dependent transport systems inner membrane component [Methylobacterium nodulans ORS 2060]